MASQPRRFTIGYALVAKKKFSFIQDSLLSLAASRGIDLLPIDLDKSLLDQGPFDCIIHKLPGDLWKSRLEEFASKHPHVTIVDRPDLIERLRNRVSMLEVVSNLSVVSSPCGDHTFGVPKQVVVLNQEELLDGNVDEAFGLRFPMIAKPLLSDGSETSHKMALVFRREGVRKLSAPIVLQEFVNHGGVIFKVYVAGDYVNCVIRNSLPDVSEEMMECDDGLVLFSQISNLPRRDSVEEKRIDDPQMPPRNFVMDIAMELRRELGLNLFNFDLIRDVKVGNHYLVIDINYFPGYAKMPSYETILTDFFWDIIHKNTRGCSSDSAGNDALELETKGGVNLDTQRKDLTNDREDGSKANADSC